MKRSNNIQSYIKNFVTDASNILAPYIAQGKLNNEFIKGKQNKKVSIRDLSIEDKKEDSRVYIEKKVFNRTLPIYLARYGILTQNMPIPGIKPIASTSRETDNSIKVNQFIQNFIVDNNFKQTYQTAIKHADVYGMEWFKTGIDWSDGNDIADVETMVGETKGSMRLREGRTFIQAVPMHEVFINNLYIEHIDEVNELVHRKPFPLEYIKKRWGFEATKEEVTETKLPTYPKYDNLGYLTGSDIEYAYVYEYYKKPDAIYPDGRFIIMINDKIIWDNQLPYENAISNRRKIPFDFLNMQSVPHHAVGVTVYQQIIPIQETFNSVKNRYLEYVNHVAIGQLYVWEGSLVNKESFSTKPGKLIGLKRNSRPPVPVQKDKLSMEFINYLKLLEDDMLVAAGLSQMTAYGMTKSNVRTDGVVDKLSESDENKLVNSLDNISETFIQVFKKVIYLEQQRLKTLHENLKIAKIDNYSLQYSLEGVNAEQLMIVNREFLIHSDTVIDKKLQQAIGMGMYNPQAGMTYASKIELLNTMKANFLIDTLDPLERATHDLVAEENRNILVKKEVPDVEDFHSHGQHVAEHNLFRLSAEIRKLKDLNPDEYKAFNEAIDLHIQQHQQFLQKSDDANQFNNAKTIMSQSQ
jgi:hypothetical protein